MAAEVGNVYMLVRYTTVKACVGGYVTMAILAKVDNIMALTLTNIDIGGEIAEKPINYKKSRRIYDDFNLIKLWIKEGVFNIIQLVSMFMCLVFTRALRFIYVTVYFYFLPFLCILFTELYLT